MSEELEELEDFEAIEGTELPVIKEFHNFQRPLAEVTGSQQELVWQKIRGDQEFTIGIYNRFSNTQEVADYYYFNAEPDDPLLLEDDYYSNQGWIYVADYTIHSKSPGCEVFKYYIHARLNKNYELEFAAFDYIEESEVLNQELNLGEVTGAEQELVWQKLNCDFKPVLRIASKEEAEKKLLNNGKLKLSASPQYAGYLVNKSNALYTHGKVTKGVRCYGHIWSYWYSIINNVLYFIGLPLWQGESTGHVVAGSGSYVRSVNIPPTEYDLSSASIGNNEFREAMNLVSEVSLWGAGKNTFENTSAVNAGAARILEKYGDKTSETELVTLVLGKVNGTNVEQYHRGDIISDIGAFSGLGGSYLYNGGFKAFSSGDFMTTTEEDSTSYSRGSSGYIPQKTKAVQEGRGMTCAYFFTSYMKGKNLTIYAQGPRFVNSVLWDDTIDFVIPSDTPNLDEPDPNPDEPDNPDPEEPQPPSPTPPGPYTPTPYPPNPVPPFPIPPNPVLQINGGYIWRAGKGVTVVGKVKTNNSPFVNVEVAYQISVKSNAKRKGTLHYPVTIEASAEGGGSYPLPEEMGGGTATLSYGVSGGGNISLTNASTASGNSVTPSGEFEKNVVVPWHAEATFGKCVKTSKQNTLNSNILTATVTTKTETIRMNLTTTIAKKPFPADVTFTVIEVNLNEAAINEIIKNNTIQKIGSNLTGTLSPSSVTGSASKTKTRRPSINATLSNSPQRNKTVAGLTQAVGEISMKITNQRIDRGQAVFSVGNNTSGWYEETMSNRGSANISGSFTVTTPARTL